MSAADKREELEAAIWPRVTPGMHESGKGASSRAVDVILALADAYAEAVADERIAGRVHDRTIGRERLAELNAAVRSGT